MYCAHCLMVRHVWKVSSCTCFVFSFGDIHWLCFCTLLYLLTCWCVVADTVLSSGEEGLDVHSLWQRLSCWWSRELWEAADDCEGSSSGDCNISLWRGQSIFHLSKSSVERCCYMTGVRSGIIEFGAIFGQGQRHGFESGGGQNTALTLV